jgi:hypothetical protein
MRGAVATCLTATLGLASGCSLPDLSDASFVEGLRILGVQAEPPEALPGDVVTLTAWTVDTRGTPVDIAWSACTLPSNGLANEGCTDGSGNGLVGLGNGPTITMVTPPLDLDVAGPPDATYGVYLPIVAHVSGANGDHIDAIYRLRVRVIAPPGCPLAPPYVDKCKPNGNPAFDRIDPLGPDGAATETYEGQIWALLPRYTDDSDQEYVNPGSDRDTVPERLITQWFATAGSFPDMPVGGTGVQRLIMDRALPPSGGNIDLWLVGHDDRGGTAITHRAFVVQ